MRLIQMSVSGAVLILVIALLRMLLLNKLPKSVFLILWGIALVRLLVPFSIPSVFSVYSLADRSQAVHSAIAESPAARLLPVSTSFAANAEAETVAPIFPVAWLTGVICMALYFAIVFLRCRWKLQTSLPVDTPFVTNWLASQKMRRAIAVRQSDRISSPLTYGILRPVILLPKHMDWENEQQLSFVFQHEYIHIRRNDLLTKLIIAATLCLHWFNPMVWIMYFLFNRDLELACDARVVRSFGTASRASYATALIDMEERRSQPAFLCNFSKNATEERIVAIMKGTSVSPLCRGLSAVLILCVAIFFATSAQAVSGGVEIPQTIPSETPDTVPAEPEKPVSESAISWIWPTEGEVSSSFGWRVHPVTGEKLYADHITIAGEAGNAVLAAADGVVAEASFDEEYGYYIVIACGNNISTIYGHLQEVSAEPGSPVNAGDRIGTVGQTGNAVSPCLSFAVFAGDKAVDPLEYYDGK